MARCGSKAFTSRRTPARRDSVPTYPTANASCSWFTAEIRKLDGKVNQEHLTLIPLSIYFKDGKAKVELALAKGRQKGDKRHAIAERDAKAEVAREMGRQRKESGMH